MNQYICGREPRTIIELIFEFVIKSMYYDLESLLGLEQEYRYEIRKHGYILRTDDPHEAKCLRSMKQEAMHQWIMERMLCGDDGAFEVDSAVQFEQERRVA